jgi:hypothetical protein
MAAPPWLIPKKGKVGYELSDAIEPEYETPAAQKAERKRLRTTGEMGEHEMNLFGSGGYQPSNNREFQTQQRLPAAINGVVRKPSK